MPADLKWVVELGSFGLVAWAFMVGFTQMRAALDKLGERMDRVGEGFSVFTGSIDKLTMRVENLERTMERLTDDLPHPANVTPIQRRNHPR